MKHVPGLIQNALPVLREAVIQKLLRGHRIRKFIGGFPVFVVTCVNTGQPGLIAGVIEAGNPVVLDFGGHAAHGLADVPDAIVKIGLVFPETVQS